MNKKYRLFGKIPVVDILIVVLLLAVLAVGVRFLTGEQVKEQTGADSQVAKTYPFEAVLCVQNTAAENEELVAVGDKLYLEDGTCAATVTAVSTKPYTASGTHPDSGEPVSTEVKGRVNLYLTVSGEATADSNKGIFVGKKRIAYNNTIPLGNEKYYWNMMTVDITREEAAK